MDNPVPIQSAATTPWVLVNRGMIMELATLPNLHVEMFIASASKRHLSLHVRVRTALFYIFSDIRT